MKQQPRWWVVIVGIVLAWAAACFAPLMGQTVAVDSAMLRQLVSFRLSDNYDEMLCMKVTATSDTSFTIDSILTKQANPPCPEGTNGLFGNADADISWDQAQHVGNTLLAAFPTFIVACGITGVEKVKLESGEQMVPRLLCVQR